MRISDSISKKSLQGFTIAELLVVIVIIGVLTTIVMLTYNGVQNNANDAAVKSDLRSIAEKVEEFRSSNTDRDYPMATQAELQDIIRVSKGSYSDGNASGSMSYCRNDTDYTIMGRSKSKQAFVISSKTGLKTVAFSGNLNDECAYGSITPTDSGFGSVWLLKGTSHPQGAGWQPWIP